MKSRIKLIIRSIAVFCAFIAFNTSNGQPTVTINFNGTGLTPGSTINVPVVINATNAGSWSFLINYDRNVLTYMSFTEGTHGTGLFGVTNNYLINAIPYLRIGLAYTGGSPGYNYTNSTVATITFTFNGGSTNLEFINISTGTSVNEVTYLKANPYSVVNTSTIYVNGSASGSGVVVNSANGGGNWDVAGKWDLNLVPNGIHDVFITKNNPITITADAICHNLTINAGAQLTLNASKTLTVTGNILLKSNQADGTASFVNLGTSNVGGTSSVERYMTGNWNGSITTSATIFHYISSPVSGGTINSFFDQLLNYWTESTQLWTNLTLPLTIPLAVGTGYSAALRSNQTITFTGGVLNTGDKTISGLTRTALNPTYDGFNLVGNIYPSALTFDNNWTLTNVLGSVYLWNPGSGNYTTYAIGSGGGVIPAEQGFFVRVSAVGAGSVAYPNSNRLHSSLAYYKTSVPDLLRLSVNGNGYMDESVIYFNPIATSLFDNDFDAYKLAGSDAAPQLYSIQEDNTNLSINGLSGMSSSNIVPLGFSVGAQGIYVITASELESFESGVTIYLEDKQAGKTINLNQNPVYSFTAAPGDPEKRFNVHFSPVGIPSVNTDLVKIYSYEKDIFVNIPYSMQGKIVVYDLVGNEITSKTIVGNSLNRISLNTSSGYYFVKVIGDSGITTGKVFIR